MQCEDLKCIERPLRKTWTLTEFNEGWNARIDNVTELIRMCRHDTCWLKHHVRSSSSFDAFLAASKTYLQQQRFYITLLALKKWGGKDRKKNSTGECMNFEVIFGMPLLLEIIVLGAQNEQGVLLKDIRIHKRVWKFLHSIVIIV